MPRRSDPKYLAADGFKCCKKCERVLPVEQFYKKEGSADGFGHKCRECVSERGRELYEVTQERQKAAAREWHRNNRERARASHSAWRDRIGRERQSQRWRSMTPEEREDYYAQQRANRAANPERFRRYDLKRRLKRFGVTLEEYDALLELQDGLCAICQGPPNGKDPDIFHTDHDHETGKLRGLLCHSCNTSLGHFRDSVETLRRAIAYLEDPPFRRITAGTLF